MISENLHLIKVSYVSIVKNSYLFVPLNKNLHD